MAQPWERDWSAGAEKSTDASKPWDRKWNDPSALKAEADKKASNPNQRTWAEFAKDVGLSGLQGVDAIAKLPAMAYDKATSGNWYGPETLKIAAMSDEREKLKSAESQAKTAAKAEAARLAGQSAKEWAGGEGLAGTAAQVAAEFGVSFKEALKDPASIPEFAAQQAAMLGVMGKTGRVADIAAQSAARAAPGLAATRAGGAVVGNAGTGAAVGTGAVLQGTDVGSDTAERLLKLPDEVWQKNTDFLALAEKIGAEAAKAQIASKLATDATLKAGAASLLTAAVPGGTAIERALVGKGSVAGLRGVPKAFVGEAAQEGAEEGSGAYFANKAVQQVNPDQQTWDGVGAAAGQGAYMGGVLGGGIQAARGTLGAEAAPKAAAADAAPVAADEVLGAAVAPPVTEAEKALTDNPTPLKERRIGEVPGAPTTFTTEAGSKIEGRYALVDADELITSHDTGLRPDPNYPQELQPRDRTRAASETQIAGIVSKLDPARLGLSADAGTGAPIIGADGLVESGNARTIALKRIYGVQGQKREDYKTWLRENAASFGVDPQAVDAIGKPVLVRVRTTEVDRAEFARQSNAPTVAAMSPAEMAKSDAARIDAMDDLRPDDQGDFATSREFIRRFVGRLSPTERGGLIDATGQLSAAGYSRVRNAVLAKAYGDSGVLTRLVESMDDNLRNISKALMIASPRVAQTRAAIGEGRLFDADLTPHLIGAVEEMGRLKEAGTSVADALAQVDMLGEKFTPETRELLGFLQENVRRPRRVAEFITSYMDALEAAGDPAQGSLLGDVTAPATQDLMTAAKRAAEGATSEPVAQNTDRRDVGEDPKPGSQGEAERGNAPRAGGSDQGLQAANEPTGSEWVAFPKDSGTLGIPRAEMPQIRGEHRGALIQFLQAKGINHQTIDKDAASLKPTQAEFSTKKADGWKEVRENVDRSVLASADGHVLDGHHQWVAALAMNEPIKVIEFDAPIRELLAATFQFPSTGRSDGAKADTAARVQARQDFKDALADLAAIASRHTRQAMVPEKTPDLMSTLIRLMEAGIKEVGYSLKDLVAYVRDELKRDPKLKTFWNKISTDLYRKAAEQAIARESAQRVDDLFAAADARMGQQDLFGEAPTAQAAKPKAAMIDGRPYDMARDNFKPPHIDTFLPEDVRKQAQADVARYFTARPPVQIPPAEQARAEALLRPLMDLANAAKADYEQKVIDIAKRSGAIGQLLAPIKSMKRGVEKVAVENLRSADDMKDMLRSTIVVKRYADAQRVVAEIEREFELARDPKNRTGDVPLRARGKDIAAEDPTRYGGYSDVLVNIRMPNGVIGEIQINVPEMLGAKDGADFNAPGHKLYEAYREAPKESPLGQEILGRMLGYYAAAAAAARNSDSLRSNQSDTGPRESIKGQATSLPDSSSLNQSPSGISTKKPPSDRSANRQPGGNLLGTSITTSDGTIVPGADSAVYTKSNGEGANVSSSQDGRNGDPGQGAEAGRRTVGRRKAASDSKGEGGRDLFDGPAADAGSAAPRELGQAGADGVGGADANSGGAEPRISAGRRAGSVLGRDIPPKSGLNYRLTDEDLTYTGSWEKKAEANIEAVELLKRLEAEGRQATREEQKTLARFIGWGASDLANNLFGDRLKKVEPRVRAFTTAKEAFSDPKVDGIDRYHKDYFAVYAPLMAANKIRYSQTITRDMVTAANFDVTPADVRWLGLRDRLKEALTPSEWADASRSTQYAHYTSKEIVRSMWAAMERFGFKGGVLLEPGAGSGVFPGLMPDGLAAASAYTGIEFDPITGGILKQLLPDERILVESFIDSKLPKNFYDAAVGNPPFQQKGAGILSDPEYKRHAFALHDYFFAKTIDRVKPGGLVMFVTSRYTMDKANDKARAYMAERADLVGAIRLPQTAFKQNAGTEVVTDVLFLRKKVPGETFEQAKAWGGVAEALDATGKPLMVSGGQDKPDRPALINEYFAANPDMVLGQHANTGSMYSDKEYTVTPIEGDMAALFAKAVESMPRDIYKAERGSSAEAAQVREIDFNPKAQKEGNYYVNDKGVLMQREGGVGQAVQGKSPKDTELIKAFVPVRDALKQAHYDQLTDGDWETSLKTLQAAYKKFTAAHGLINQSVAKVVKVKVDELDDEGNPTGNKVVDEETRRSYPLLNTLKDDPDYTLFAALEKVNDETGEVAPSAFLGARVLGKPEAAKIDTPADALLSTLNDLGRVDVEAIAHRIGLDEAATIEALGSAIYEDPEAGWQTADEYLSGNVKAKLGAAREAAKNDRRFARNIEALEAAQPAPKSPAQINASIGMNWIPGSDYERFLKETTGVSATVKWNDATRQWSVAETAGGHTMAATVDWGTGSRNATELLDHALTGRPVRVTKNIGAGRDSKPVFDPVATEAANVKLAKLREAFEAWVWRDADRANRLVQVYNDKFNTTVPRAFDGRHLSLPGASKQYHIFDHVKRGAWRIVQAGNTYLAHAVGSGKTFQMVISAMEQKRLGLVKKPMIVVPNHMLQQFAREWQDLYPAARLMVADENNFHTDNRRRFVSRVALSDLDGVIITHSAFKLMDVDPAFKQGIIEEQLNFLRAALEEAEAEEGKGGKRAPRVKQIEKQIENLEQKLEAQLSGEGKDRNVRFDELGVDFLYVDEAHEFRKLDYATSRQVKGIQPTGSARALDLYIKSRYLESKRPGRSLVMASGTPVTNTLAELYSVGRFMDRQGMIDKGIEDFDSWASMFGRERTALEPNAAGKYEPVTRFSKFVNVPELTQMFRNYADVVTADQLAAMLGDKRPKVDGGSRKIVVTPKSAAYTVYQKDLARRVDVSRNWKPTKDEPNNPDPVIKIIGDGRLAAIDMRFVNPAAPSNPTSKLNVMIDDVIRTLKETADFEYTDKAGQVEPNKGASVMVFSDLGFGAGVAASRGFNARAWFEKRLRDEGINMGQVAFMSDYKKSTDKLKLFKDVNAGRVRLLIGSSKNMGTGVNAQQRLKALFHLDSPWYPADLEQREGRIVRQGNKNKLVQLYAYAAKGTYDENMWKMLASKQFFIDQALNGDENLREVEDLDSQSQFDMAAAMVADDPRVMQLAGARAEVEKLGRLFRAHEDQRMGFRSQYGWARDTIAANEKLLPDAEAAAIRVQDLSGDRFAAKVGKATITERAKWGEALLARFKAMWDTQAESQSVGEISGFKVNFVSLRGAGTFSAYVQLDTPVPAKLITDGQESPVGVAMRAQNSLSEITRAPARMREIIEQNRARMDALRERLETPFPMAGMLADKVKEAEALEAELAAAGKPRTWRVERVDTGLGHEVQATSEAEAIDLAVQTNGGLPADWRAIEGGGQDPTVAFSLGASVALSVGERATEGVAADEVEKRLKGFAHQPPVKIRASAIGEIPGATDDTHASGAVYEGSIYLFLDHLADRRDVQRTLFHELLHYGLRRFMTRPQYEAKMLDLYSRDAAIRGEADRWAATPEGLAVASKMGGKYAKARGVDEALAQLAEVNGGEYLQTGWTQRTYRAVLAWMGDVAAALGFQGAAAHIRGLKNQEARALIQQVFAQLRQDAPAASGDSAFTSSTAFSSAQPFSRGQENGQASAAERAEAIIQKSGGTPKPLDAVARTLTRITGLERLTVATYGLGARLLDRVTPEKVKAGIVSDYGVPEAVIDQRAMLQGRQREQLRQAGKLLEKLATLTRQESRVAYEWMSGDDTRTADEIMADLPAESVQVLREVRQMVDDLSKEAVRLGQLEPEAFEKHRFAYLRRTYFKHAQELTTGEKAARQRAISIMGDQYKGRGMVAKAPMKQIQNGAPDWWQRKIVDGKADTSLKGQMFQRLERRAASGEGTATIEGMEDKKPGKLLEVNYWPVGEPRPAKYADWTHAGNWEVRDTKGADLVLWRDFTKAERAKMGEIDEARYAIAKTLHRMIHDVEVGKYLEWLAQNHAKADGDALPGPVVEASERYKDTFAPSEWVQVPDAKIAGTNVQRYGKLAGLYLPGPIWNDLRQVVNGRFMPFGETYAKILGWWKVSKTALSPGVHTNNVMSNMVMADWHDVSAGHVAKSLRIILGASEREGRGLLGRTGNAAARAGVVDREAAQEILTRYENSGGAIGGWVTQEIANEQLAPVVEALQKELQETAAAAAPHEIGVYAALNHALHARFPQAWEAAKGSKPGKAVGTEAQNLIDLYQAEDDVFRLAAWLKAKEDGMTDAEAGKVARRSFLDYSINAPWIAAMRQSVLPFISFTYRAVPMLLETAAKRPHKLLKLMAIAGALNALGMIAAGGDDEDEEKTRKMLPEEKAGGIWGMVPKLIRMPWNDDHGSPVYLDVRRWAPVGDVLDLGQGHAAVPVPPSLMPGGPVALFGELMLNRSMFTGKPITLETDTAGEKAEKVVDYLWKAFAPNILGLPGSYATEGVVGAAKGRTDAFGREMSVPQAVASSFGVKTGSYPDDVLRRNIIAKREAEVGEIEKQIAQLRRQNKTRRIDQAEFEKEMAAQREKIRRVREEANAKLN